MSKTDATTTTQNAARDRTLQDDRAELAADPHEGSPLEEGEGAPLAEDGVSREEPPVTIPGLLGGAPVDIASVDTRAPAGLTASDDRPIDD